MTAGGYDPSVLLALAVDIAEEAGELLRTYADGRDLEVRTKSSATDPVTIADQASERLIVHRLEAARPDDGLLGEEATANREGTTGLRWVFDPLDGTVNYLYRIPQWCVSIACEDGEGSLVGVVHDPNRCETFRAVRGSGASSAGRPLRVGSVDDLGAAIVATGFSYDAEVRAAQGRQQGALVASIRDLRRFGAAALDLAWVADGRIDGYAEFNLAPWDWAAGRLLVREAGGVVSMPEVVMAGQVQVGMIAANVPLHDALARWLAG